MKLPVFGAIRLKKKDKTGCEPFCYLRKLTSKLDDSISTIKL